MVASCYRQSGNHQKAYETFSQVHSKFPENAECLKSLIKMATDMGKDAAKEWSNKLLKLEKQDDSRAATGLPKSSGQGHSSMSLRESARTPKSDHNSGWSMTSQDRMMGISTLDLEEKKVSH
jgi:tetratricopeptide (TPR) repeat protein